MANLVLFSKSNCMKCKFTQQYLDKYGIKYQYRDVEKDRSAYDTVTNDYGFSGLPVVAVSTEEVDLSKFTGGEEPTVFRFGSEFVFADFRINILEEVKDQLQTMASN